MASINQVARALDVQITALLNARDVLYQAESLEGVVEEASRRTMLMHASAKVSDAIEEIKAIEITKADLTTVVAVPPTLDEAHAHE